MFIIENGKISGNKTVDIGKSIIVNLQFKSDIAFADDDKLLLNIGGLQSSNYAFTQGGCFRFSYVNVGSLITSSSNSVNVVITNNGNQILSDSITILAEYSGGGGGDIDLSDYATKDYVIENAPIKTAPIALGCNSYDRSTKTGTLADGGAVSITDSLQGGDIITLTHVISSEYDISPNDEFGVALSVRPYSSNSPITAKLYLNDQLIRQGSINIAPLDYEASVRDVRYVIGLNTNYKDEILKNNIGKTLKLQLLFSYIFGISQTIQLAKNIPIYGVNQIENGTMLGAFVQQYTDKNSYYTATSTTSISFNKSNAFCVPIASSAVPIQNLTLNIPSKTYHNLTYIITTAQTFTYTATIGSDFYLNKPLDLQPNKTYAICQYYNYIFWTQLTAYGA